MLKVNSNNWPPFRQVQPTTFMSGWHTAPYVHPSVYIGLGWVCRIYWCACHHKTIYISNSRSHATAMHTRTKKILSITSIFKGKCISEEVHNSVNENIYLVYFMYTLCVKFVWKMYLTNLVQAETCDHNLMFDCCSAKYES